MTNKIRKEYNTPMSAQLPAKGMKMYADLERKICCKCKAVKTVQDFYRRSDRPTGRMPYCKECHKVLKAKNKAENAKRYQEYEFARALRRHYKITVEQYRTMLKNQNNCCACCGVDESLFKNKLHVDHDHATGQIRALLCTQCNPGIGYFEHSIERLEMAIRYLNKFKN